MNSLEFLIAWSVVSIIMWGVVGFDIVDELFYYSSKPITVGHILFFIVALPSAVVIVILYLLTKLCEIEVIKGGKKL